MRRTLLAMLLTLLLSGGFIQAAPGRDVLKAGRQRRQTAPQPGEGGQRSVTVTETFEESDTSVGHITTHCLVLVSDPSQSFCQTSLNGEPLGRERLAAASSASISASPSTLPPTTSAASSSAFPPGTVSLVQSTQAPASQDLVSSSATHQVTPTTAAPTSFPTAEPASPTADTSGFSATTQDAVTVEPSPSPSPSQASSLDSVITPGPTSVAAAESSVLPTSEDSLATTTEQGQSTPISSSTSVAASASLSLAAVSASVTSPEIASVTTSPEVEAAESEISSASTSRETVLTITTDLPPASAAPPSVVSTTPASSLASASAAAAASASASSSLAIAASAGEGSNTSEQFPGQTISVLPIGLSIFGGLVGLTLLIVGYMLYQRRLYRRQFARRQEAEKALMNQAAELGYSGAR